MTVGERRDYFSYKLEGERSKIRLVPKLKKHAQSVVVHILLLPICYLVAN